MEEVTPEVFEEVTEVFSATEEPTSESVLLEEVATTEEPIAVEETTPELQPVAATKSKTKKTSVVEPTPEPEVVAQVEKPKPINTGGITIFRSTKTN
jgi:hypothetical protein